MSEPAGDDDTLERCLQELLEQYEGVVPPELMAEMQAFLGDALATHPVAATLLDRVRPRAVPFQSGDAAKPGVDPDELAMAVPKKEETG